MDIILIAFFIICFYGVSIKSQHKDYLSYESTTCIKGIFAILILFSHSKGYLLPPPF